jgi:signal transduction histidine kinase
MRLSVFILDHSEQILQAWEAFARSLLPGRSLTVSALRDHAEEMLRFIAADIESKQTEAEGFAKSLGQGLHSPGGEHSAAQQHGLTRALDRFTLGEMVSEFRALRASVTMMWLDVPGIGIDEARQLVRFNEAIDQLMAESVTRFAAKLDWDSDLFTAAIGHDLRNPVNSVVLATHVLTKSDGLPEHAQIMLGRIKDATSRLQRLLGDLGDFSRSRLGGLTKLNRSECDVAQLCRNVVGELIGLHPEIIVTQSGDTRAFVDPLRIEQLASNLVANAVQHGEQNGSIEVSIVEKSDDVELVVHNVGCPIPSDGIDDIFDPLVRGGNEGDRSGVRLGLGLYVAREIALAHGGSISVVSAMDTGTSFIVRVPRAAPVAALRIVGR